MCGIAGVLKLDGTALDSNSDAVLLGMVREMAYRGPDDEQILRDGPVGFAFRRLAIIDLPGGRQPLRNEDGSLLLMANGEIYNHQELRAALHSRHQFRTRSDCEIVLHLYEEKGVQFLDDLIGMYALAVWDRRRRRLILARDRFGIKPLFYTVNQDRLVFASEIKALLRYPDCPRRFDWVGALVDPWLNGTVSTNPTDPMSFFQGIEHLPAGCLLEVDVPSGRTERRRYWALPLVGDGGLSPEPVADRELVDSYAGFLEDSVRRCLMSDVEVGLFLSGGIDSAAVATIAAKHREIHTFTVLSLSTLANDDAKYAHLTARQLGLPNHQVVSRWDNHDFDPTEWKRLVWLCETPFCGPEQLYKYHLYRYARAVRPGLKVILTGQGSDEFNGGYSSMIAPSENQSWDGFLASLDVMERGRLLRASPSSVFVWEEHFRQPLLSKEFLLSISGERDYGHGWHAYLATKYRDLQMYNCWHEDRTAAGNSVENRVPFLDHRLVEFTLQIPADKHPALFWDKQVLREAMARHLPPDVCRRPKVPFFYGNGTRYTHRMMLALLMRDNFALIEEAFSSRLAAAFIDRDAVLAAVQEVTDDPEAANVEFLLRLVNMGLLEQMAAAAGRNVSTECSVPVPRAMTIDDWNQAEEQIHLEFSIRREGLDQSVVPALAPNVCLMRREDSGGSQESYLVVDDKVEYVLSEAEAKPWLCVLRQMDGKRTLGEILAVAGVSEAQVREYLEEAMDYGLITIRAASPL